MARNEKSINWKNFFDKNILLIFSSFLFIFIPLYPKLPLFDLIEGYIVRVRLEDFLIAIAMIVYFIQVLRKKVTIHTPLTKFIFAYIIVGFFSFISGVFITQTIPTTQVHLFKSFLHLIRYIEYFSLFFLVFSSIKSKKDVEIVSSTFVTTLLLVGLYGLGQKYLYWPVFSTMNREFSKGVILYLTEHARVQSTFAGHYDMAAYLVILLPIVIAFLFKENKKTITKIVLWSSYIIGLIMIMLSASRTSLAGLIVGIILTISIITSLKNPLSKKIIFFIKESLTHGFIFLLLFFIFGSSMAERLMQVVEKHPKFIAVTENIEETKSYFIDNINFLNKNLLKNKPNNSLSTEQAEVLVSSDTLPTPVKPSDVYVDVPNKIQVATVSAEGIKTFLTIEMPRTYSENALRVGLSMAIRLDTLWPQALKGFYINPLLGSGYATLTKSSVNEFTEADSTDNNFLRTLGETGLLGLLTFYGSIVISLAICIQVVRSKLESDYFKKLFAIGFIGSSIGLLVNATFIDVFASSKVAYTYWSLAGVVLAYANLKTTTVVKTKKINQKKHRIKTKKGTFSNT